MEVDNLSELDDFEMEQEEVMLEYLMEFGLINAPPDHPHFNPHFDPLNAVADYYSRQRDFHLLERDIVALGTPLISPLASPEKESPLSNELDSDGTLTISDHHVRTNCSSLASSKSFKLSDTEDQESVEEEVEEASLGKRSPFRGLYPSSETRKKFEDKFAKSDAMRDFYLRTIGQIPCSANIEKTMKRDRGINISKAMLRINERKVPMTVLERKWESRGKPKKSKMTKEEKEKAIQANKAARNKRYYDKKKAQKSNNSTTDVLKDQ